MKYLKKFVESKDIKDIYDIEYISQCFIDLLEDPNNYLDYESDSEGNQITWELVCDTDKDESFTTVIEEIDSILKYNNELNELLENIKVSIKKVKMKYPEFSPAMNFEHADIDGFDYVTSVTIFLR